MISCGMVDGRMVEERREDVEVEVGVGEQAEARSPNVPGVHTLLVAAVSDSVV